MCIAIYKPKNIELPSMETLKVCFSNNPHGAGFVTDILGSYPGISVFKGYFTFEDFYKKFIQNVKKEHVCLIHFRYATHGIKNKENCHPFVFYKYDKKDKYHEHTPSFSALIHNGVINNGLKNKKRSDTFWLTKQIEKGRKVNDEVFKDTNNKVAIINSDKSVELYGNWTEDNNIFYSNGTYRFDCAEESIKQNKNLTFCDCCGTIGENFFDTDVGYHFCNYCLKNEVSIKPCRHCGMGTTNDCCNSCNDLGFFTNYFE